MSVSVVIPTFNSVFLREALASVLAQTVPPLEIIVVDSSPESTKKTLEDYQAEIRYLYEPPRGVSSARNTGMKVARGDYIAFLDADDLWFPEKLEVQMKAFEQFPEAAFSFSTVWNLTSSPNDRIPREPFNPVPLIDWVARWKGNNGVVFGRVYDLLLHVNCVATSSLIVRRRVIEEVGFFDEAFANAEDYDYELRLAKRYPAVFILAPTSRYRVIETGLSGGWESRPEIFFESNLRVLHKHVNHSFSVGVLRALSRTYANHAGWRLAKGERLEARGLALKSLAMMPSIHALKLYLESLSPALYARVADLYHRQRAKRLKEN
jgi:glycosyltransferase involved in cell wall biosynthesis